MDSGEFQSTLQVCVNLLADPAKRTQLYINYQSALIDGVINFTLKEKIEAMSYAERKELREASLLFCEGTNGYMVCSGCNHIFQRLHYGGIVLNDCYLCRPHPPFHSLDAYTIQHLAEALCLSHERVEFEISKAIKHRIQLTEGDSHGL